jgi:hypothetical protein
MKIKEFFNKNLEKIKLYIIFLDHLQEEFNKKNYNIHKIMSEFFMQILNNEDINYVKTKFLKDIKEKQLFLLYDIDFNKEIDFKKIKYHIKYNNDIVNVNFDIKYNNTSINIYKNIPIKIYEKIKKKKVEKYLLFFYIMVGFDTGNFWGLNPKFYNYIKENYKTAIECFASPFNNNLDNFFSLIYPIDKYYGSKCDFFENFLKVKYDVYIINPPFVESIINRVLSLIEQKMKSDNIQIFMYIPQWDDLILPWYDKINKIYNSKLFKLKKNNSILFDYINNKPIKDTFGTYLICINNISSDLYDKIEF